MKRFLVGAAIVCLALLYLTSVAVIATNALPDPVPIVQAEVVLKVRLWGGQYVQDSWETTSSTIVIKDGALWFTTLDGEPVIISGTWIVEEK